MKTRIKSIVVVVVALVAISSGILFANATKQKQLASYNPELTHSDVRVVLLQVSRMTVLTDKWYQSPEAKGIVPVPCLQITYFVDLPKSLSGSTNLMFKSFNIDVFSKGKKITDQIAP